MSATARLSLPYIAPQQAQKQVTYNAAMAALDQLVQPAVKSRTTAAPPGSPTAGDAYIVGPSATGAWVGKDNRLAIFADGAWTFRAAAEGWLAYVTDIAELSVFRSGAWARFADIGGAGLAKFGVHVEADLTNRLAIASAGSLFTHDGAGHRLTLNKATAADTASLLFDDNFSGRAEIGLTGDDALHVKVSANGSTWTEALTIAQASGLVTLPAGQLAFPATQSASTGANVLDDYEEGIFTPTLLFTNGSTGVTYNSASTLGRYTKVGRLVTATAMVTLTSKGSSTGNTFLGGLPFTALNDGIFSSAAVSWVSGLSSVTGAITAMVLPNRNQFQLWVTNNGATIALPSTSLGNTSAFYVSASYEAQ
jgi:hypothetical protein